MCLNVNVKPYKKLTPNVIHPTSTLYLTCTSYATIKYLDSRFREMLPFRRITLAGETFRWQMLKLGMLAHVSQPTLAWTWIRF